MSAEEAWLPIPGWEGHYEISDHGRVRSVDRTVAIKGGHRRRYSSQLKKIRADMHGRPWVCLHLDGKKTNLRIHRLVIETFIGPPPEGMECCHNDGDKLNNRLNNLRWDTRSANTQDQLRHGVHHQASKTHCHKGHPFSGDNLITLPEGTAMRRRCRQCQRDRDRDYKRALRETPGYVRVRTGERARARARRAAVTAGETIATAGGSPGEEMSHQPLTRG